MPTARLRNDSPTLKVRNVDLPTLKIGNDMPTTRLRSDMPTARGLFQSGPISSTTNSISIGNPIGLLLILTYAAASVSTLLGSGDGPTARIRND